ncbi:MAG: tetratricopeptide repeat protein [Xanthomonadales bacterium]|jgi:protein O-GlcNAc transferase|nr:tetratricopeptide repeat protein [Xanthomonadales bacterium]
MGFLKRILSTFRSTPSSFPTNQRSVAALQLIDEGQVEEKAGRLDEAARCYREAIAKDPGLAKAYMNLGNVHRARSNHESALLLYAKAVDLDPKSADAHYNLGNAHWDLRQNEQAVSAYRMATTISADHVAAWISLGHALASVGLHTEAVEAGRNAVAAAPNNAEAHFVLSLGLKNSGQLDEYLNEIRQTIAIQPDHFPAISDLATFQTDALDLEGAQATYRSALRTTPHECHLQASLIFLMSHDPSIGPDQLFNAHLEFGSIAERHASGRKKTHNNSRDPNRPLRVGFVSADLRNHAVSHFVEPLFRCLSANRTFLMFAYHNHYLEDETSKSMKEYFYAWRSISQLSDDQAADLIMGDEIDILIDLSGHTYRNRLELFALRAAPIQASWIGYPGTTGLKSMDYYFADKYFLPEDPFSKYFVEKFIYLPTTAPYLPYPNAPEISPLPALSSGSVTFASMNRHPKINRRVVSLWARLLHKVPNSRIIIGAMNEQKQADKLAKWLIEEGIRSDQFSFKFRIDPFNYLLLHREFDMCVDTFPYAGGTTIRHALWMGVPTLTIAGTTPASRQGSSILEAAGLGGFVARSDDEFVAIGSNWASRLEELAQIRSSLRHRLEASPLRKPELIAQAFEQATRIMWQRWCRRDNVENIDITQPTQCPNQP